MICLNIQLLDHIIIANGIYVLELCLFFPEISVIVETAHHFDLMFYTQNFENQQKIIRNIIKAYPNIIYYENLEVKNDNRLHK